MAGSVLKQDPDVCREYIHINYHVVCYEGIQNIMKDCRMFC